MNTGTAITASTSARLQIIEGHRLESALQEASGVAACIASAADLALQEGGATLRTIEQLSNAARHLEKTLHSLGMALAEAQAAAAAR